MSQMMMFISISFDLLPPVGGRIELRGGMVLISG
jgi:hypothetical protein